MYVVKYGGLYLHDPRGDDELLHDLELGIELNTCGYCTFSISPDHPLRWKLRERDPENPIEVYDCDELIFAGYVWELGLMFELTGKVSCKGELAYFGDSIVRPYSTVDGEAQLVAPSTVDGYFAWLVSQHNAHVSPSQRFEVGVNQGAALDPNNHVLRSSSQLPTTAAEMQEKLLDRLGGYVFARREGGRRKVDYLSECVDVNAQVIDFGENLLDFMRTDSASALRTCVVPIGGKPEKGDGEGEPQPVTVESLPDGAYSKDGAYFKQGDRVYNVEAARRYGIIEAEWDESDETDPAALLDKAVVKLKGMVEPKTTIEVKAVDAALYMEGFKPLRVGQFVRVRSRPHDFDSYMLVSKIEPNLNDPSRTVYTLGTTYDTITGETNKQIRRLNASINEAYDAMAPISQAAKDAAKLAETAEQVAQDALGRVSDLKGAYVHVKWSDNPDGSGMSSAPGPYMGVCTDDSPDDPTDPGAYAWVKVKGDDGVRGDDGVDGAPSYLHVKWSDSSDGNPMSETPGAYMGTCVTSGEADPADRRLYTWLRVKGEQGPPGLDGLQGKDGKDGIQGPPGEDGRSSYTHIAYADSADGTLNFSASDSNRKYVGMYVDYAQVDSTDPADYAWTLVKGADGKDGTAGKAGADGRTPYLHIAYATNSTGTAGFSLSDSAGKTHIGQYTDYVQADSTDPSKYSWTLIKGDPGKDGATLYTWVKYADTPTSGMSDDPAGKAYMGLAYNKTLPTESSNYSDYQWALVKGPKGDQGIEGGKGADGKTYYTWVKYADNASGAGMSDSPAGKTYIGLAYNKPTAAESTNPADYAWSLIKGDKGDKGTDGRGVKSATVTYQAGASGTAAPTGTWSAAVPAVAANQYLWTRMVVTYTDGTTTTAYSVGKMGANGANGAAGKGIKSTVVTYQAGASGTAAPTGTWSAAVPVVAAGQYLWTRMVVTYTDNSTTTAYNVARQGANGANGSNGKPGTNGTDGKMLYGASNTAQATAAKTTASNIAGFSLYVGVTVSIKFTYANTAASPTLNVNGTGAKPVLTNGVNAAYWEAGATVIFVWNGTYWCCGSAPVYATTATIGNPAGGNVYVDGSSMNVRQGSGVLARFTASLVELGKNSASAVIDMVAGLLKISANTVGGQKWANIQANTAMRLRVPRGQALYMTQYDAQGQDFDGVAVGINDSGVHLKGTVVINDLPVRGMKSLFRNDSAPFDRPVTLSETAANFSELEIFFKTNDGHYSSCKVQSPNGKVVDLTVNVFSPAAGAAYIKAKAVKISGTSIDTLNSGGYMTGEGGVGNNYSMQHAGDFIAITGVIGYR